MIFVKGKQYIVLVYCETIIAENSMKRNVVYNRLSIGCVYLVILSRSLVALP